MLLKNLLMHRWLCKLHEFYMNLKRLRQFLFFLIFSTLGIVVWPYVNDFCRGVAFTQDELSQEERLFIIAQEQKNKQYDMVIKHLTVPHTQLSQDYNLTLSARNSKLMNGSDLILCSDITGTIKKEDKALIFLKATDAFFNRTKNYLFFPHSINCTYDALHITGTKVFYDINRHLISSQEPFSYQHPNFSLTGQKSKIDLKNKRIYLSNGVTSQFSQCATSDNCSKR